MPAVSTSTWKPATSTSPSPLSTSTSAFLAAAIEALALPLAPKPDSLTLHCVTGMPPRISSTMRIWSSRMASPYSSQSTSGGKSPSSRLLNFLR